MRYAKINLLDVANGPGVRVSLFVSGCEHYCPNCFNPEAWDFEYGYEFTDDTMKYILENLMPTHIRGFSILGGEPFHPKNIKTVEKILKEVSLRQIPTWVWTGYTIEELLEREECFSPLLLIDTLVDGRFEEEKKDLRLRFRGSRNQRIIDSQATVTNMAKYVRPENPVVEREEYY